MFNYAELGQLYLMDKKKTYNCELPFYVGNSESVCRRDILIQWVISQSQQFKHQPKTFELAVYYIDNYLNFFNIGQEYLELLAISAYSMASRYNETENIAQIKLYNNQGQGLYEDQEYDEMEIQILKSLDYQLNRVTISDYLIALQVPLSETIQSLIMFVLMDFEIYKHSQIVLALAIFNFYTEQHEQFQPIVISVTKLINSKIMKAQNQYITDKSETDESRDIDQNLRINKSISKRRDPKKKKQII